MTRIIGLTLFTVAIAAFLLTTGDDRARAQEPGAKEKDKEPAKKGEAKDEADGNDPDRIQKIIEKLSDDFEKADDRLGKNDPGKDTRLTQDEIIKGLDELIKQKDKNDKNNQGGGGGGGGGGGQSGSSGQSGGGQSGSKGGGGQNGGQSSSKGGGGNQSKGQAGLNEQKKNQGGGGQEKKKNEDLAKKDGEKKEKGGQGGAGNEKGKGGAGGNGGGINNPPPEKNTIADLHKEVWGHLPDRERTKMDVYSRERFMPRYEEVLRQYYRTIAEQGRRKEGELP